MKYIMLKRKIHSGMEQEFPIIFPNQLVHSDVAAAIKSLPDLKDATIISAGEFSGIDGECSGESNSIGIKSRREDSHIIRMMDYLHGIIF